MPNGILGLRAEARLSPTAGPSHPVAWSPPATCTSGPSPPASTAPSAPGRAIHSTSMRATVSGPAVIRNRALVLSCLRTVMTTAWATRTGLANVALTRVKATCRGDAAIQAREERARREQPPRVRTLVPDIPRHPQRRGRPRLHPRQHGVLPRTRHGRRGREQHHLARRDQPDGDRGLQHEHHAHDQAQLPERDRVQRSEQRHQPVVHAPQRHGGAWSNPSG